MSRSPASIAQLRAAEESREKDVRFSSERRRIGILDFDLVSVLGKGGYSTAWKAVFKEHPQSLFAIKATSKQE